ncbi:hypothetical protein COV18_02985 [Candidatus Woesearchaeota archaeon CG10_big_fil_rev_8_21_14_0_10_37_12]|nr:MAG: hypothetical protein COV18_02985 [Candidatus Woesearchaeota archaeon CG10_big_fil_rev_8_21_14_0_10_37_12]
MGRKDEIQRDNGLAARLGREYAKLNIIPSYASNVTNSSATGKFAWAKNAVSYARQAFSERRSADNYFADAAQAHLGVGPDVVDQAGNVLVRRYNLIPNDTASDTAWETRFIPVRATYNTYMGAKRVAGYAKLAAGVAFGSFGLAMLCKATEHDWTQAGLTYVITIPSGILSVGLAAVAGVKDHFDV